MNELQYTSSTIPLPLPRAAVETRVATIEDLPFIDALQKKHSKMVGWMPTQQLEGKIEKGNVLIAEEGREDRGEMIEDRKAGQDASLLSSIVYPLSSPLGYVIGQDQYFKRDDVGIVYQMNVEPGKQRSLVGATLLKALFERAAYGCRLFCCWCAQDIEANYFWESMGFVPLAFRAGSRGKDRVHIFWQRRIRAGDCETPYWFPSQTSSGAIREDRLVFPIPPGVNWNDEMPRVFPEAQRALPEKSDRKMRMPKPRVIGLAMGGLRFGPSPAEKSKRKRQAIKNDPAHIAAARELRDRWLERVNADPKAIESPEGKYEVTKQIASTPVEVPRMLPVFPQPLAA